MDRLNLRMKNDGLYVHAGRHYILVCFEQWKRMQQAIGFYLFTACSCCCSVHIVFKLNSGSMYFLFILFWCTYSGYIWNAFFFLLIIIVNSADSSLPACSSVKQSKESNSINCIVLIAFVKTVLCSQSVGSGIDGFVQDYSNVEQNLWHSTCTATTIHWFIFMRCMNGFYFWVEIQVEPTLFDTLSKPVQTVWDFKPFSTYTYHSTEFTTNVEP